MFSLLFPYTSRSYSSREAGLCLAWQAGACFMVLARGWRQAVELNVEGIQETCIDPDTLTPYFLSLQEFQHQLSIIVVPRSAKVKPRNR